MANDIKKFLCLFFTSTLCLVLVSLPIIYLLDTIVEDLPGYWFSIVITVVSVFVNLIIFPRLDFLFGAKFKTSVLANTEKKFGYLIDW